MRFDGYISLAFICLFVLEFCGLGIIIINVDVEIEV